MARKKTGAAVPSDRVSTAALMTGVMQSLYANHPPEQVKIAMANEQLAARPPRLSTGCITLDVALGGGFTTGKFHTMWGPPSAAKTLTCLSTVAYQQKCCGYCGSLLDHCVCGNTRPFVCVYISTENDLDRRWMEAIGVDVSQLILFEPAYGEAGLDAAYAFVMSGQVDLLVVDSIAFLTPVKETEKSVAEDHMGIRARLLSQGFRKLMSALVANKNSGTEETSLLPTALLTNHVRADLKIMFGSNEVKPGGKTPEYAAISEVRLAPTKIQKDKLGATNGIVSYRVSKNKAGVPGDEGKYKIGFVNETPYKKGRYYETHQIQQLLKAAGAMEEAGVWASFDGLTFKSKVDFFDQFYGDISVWAKTREFLIREVCYSDTRHSYATDGGED